MPQERLSDEELADDPLLQYFLDAEAKYGRSSPLNPDNLAIPDADNDKD